ncbi:GIY-YIG nuclease family protein [Bradyrhizobium tropiciagri]|nr:GIY-YIG nuclease family protein [Bradyrhizobium tropiciagri]
MKRSEIRASRLEARVHQILGPYHLRGEWFDCSLDQQARGRTG